jgi:hypothetical protein
LALTKIEASNIAAGAVASSGFIGYTVYTGGATWNKSTNSPTKIVVEVVGGGGGSGQGYTGWGHPGGGGSGGYVRKFIDVSSISTATIVVGAGGVKNEGTSAGNSSWTDSANTLTGGLGGNGTNGGAGASHGTGGLAGTAAGGDMNIPGENGLVGNAHNPAFLASTMLSTGGYGYTRTANTYGASSPGCNYGGGASPGRGDNAMADGSDGAAGVVIVWEYK